MSKVIPNSSTYANSNIKNSKAIAEIRNVKYCGQTGETDNI